MNYCAIKDCDIADGPGVRVSLFVAGCHRHCKGCQNESTWDFNSGEHFGLDTMVKLMKMLEPSYITGLTILGGEPMDPENVERVFNICHHVRQRYPEKTIWLYSGYTYEELYKSYPIELHDYVDVLVDGPYIEKLRNLNLRFRGSENQRIVDVQKSTDKVVLWEEPIEHDPEFNMQGYDRVII